jgi:hypothetical protein
MTEPEVATAEVGQELATVVNGAADWSSSGAAGATPYELTTIGTGSVAAVWYVTGTVVRVTGAKAVVAETGIGRLENVTSFRPTACGAFKKVAPEMELRLDACEGAAGMEQQTGTQHPECVPGGATEGME